MPIIEACGTEIPAASSCVQYGAIPAPISAMAVGDALTGWSGAESKLG